MAKDDNLLSGLPQLLSLSLPPYSTHYLFIALSLSLFIYIYIICIVVSYNNRKTGVGHRLHTWGGSHDLRGAGEVVELYMHVSPNVTRKVSVASAKIIENWRARGVRVSFGRQRIKIYH